MARTDLPCASALLCGLLIATSSAVSPAQPSTDRLYAYVSVGDNQWVSDWPPVDSPATVDALFDWLGGTYGIRRVYWRGEQDRMWLEHYLFRPENALYYDWWTGWVGHLSGEVRTDDLAVAAARRRGMQIYVFDGLFEHAAQGDVGGCGQFPYSNEDKLRIEHPEWCPVDRFGERIAPGPIEFCYPEARKALIERYVDHVTGPGYDGISFYTYVENMGMRFDGEFGYNDPIVQEFQRRYGVDIRTQPFDRDAWGKLRGEYVTQFLRELHEALSAAGKKLSVVLRPDKPHLPQRWLCLQTEVLCQGNVYLDWETWVKEGIVDELVLWCGGGNTALTVETLAATRGTGIEVHVALAEDLRLQAEPALGQVGLVRPQDNGELCIDALTLEPVSAQSLTAADWPLRAQALADAAAGKLTLDAAQISGLLHDPHVMVRRGAVRTIAALKLPDQVPALEQALEDPEPSVRIQAVKTLGVLHGPETAQRIMAALEHDGGFQFKYEAVPALKAIGEANLPALSAALASRQWWVREVAVRAMSAYGNPERRELLLRSLASDPDYRVRYWAADSLRNYPSADVAQALRRALKDGSSTVELSAARTLGECAGQYPAEETAACLSALCDLFTAYGDGSQRTDAAWGWRVVGRAILAYGESGRWALDQFRGRNDDRWLAWAAYEVLYVPQDPSGPVLCDEAEALRLRQQYAPPFPGRRTG